MIIYIKNKLLAIKHYLFSVLNYVMLFFVFLSTLLTITWFLFYQKQHYPKDVHISLQTQLKTMLKKKILQKSSAIKNIIFHKMKTKSMRKKNQIKAFFTYSYDDFDKVNVLVKGQAIINREINSVSRYDLWNISKINNNNKALYFSKPINLH